MELLFVDDDLIVAEKPAALLCVPGRGPDKQDCFSARIQRRYPDALIVHRLDRDTSGLLILARNKPAQSALARQFELRQVRKTYVADVWGAIEHNVGEVDLPIGKDLENPPRYRVDVPWAKPSLTRWRVVHRGVAQCRLELSPITGRSHQLRVHMSAISHPILGDPLYGDADSAERLRLHAAALTFQHPTSGRTLALTSPTPF